MIRRILRWKHHLSARVLDEERVFVLGGGDPVLLRGPAYALVAPLLDGTRTIAQIAESLTGKIAVSDVFLALVLLEQNGHVVERRPESSLVEAAYWEERGLEEGLAAERLAATPVLVHAEQGEQRHAMSEALRGAGVVVSSPGEPSRTGTLHVVVAGDYLDPHLADFNRRAQGQGLAWTLVRVSSASTWVGPVFQPGEGPCWECLAHRLRLNRPVEVYLERRGGERACGPVRRAAPVLPSAAQVGFGLAALWIARFIASGDLAVSSSLVTLDPLGTSNESHPVVRRPECPACGDPALSTAAASRPVVLQSRPKRFTADGGHRTETPEQTWARLSRNVSPLTGIVTSVGPVPERDHPMRPVYGSAFRQCPALDAPGFDDFHRITMGKGRTAAQARASAVCEAIERYCLGFQGDEPRRRARRDDLAGEAVSPDDLQNFSEAQLRRRDETNALVARLSADANQLVPVPFDPRVVIDWSPVWSLTRSRRLWVPTTYCYSNMRVAPEEQFCHANPNGHAAGNTLEEAILQAFFELVERDSVAIWWYNRLCRPGVDLASFGEPYFTDLEAHYRTLDYRLWVLDVTTDMGIPAFAALCLPEGREGRWHMGFGCHIEARLGVQRALTEVNQLFDPSLDAPSPWEPRGLDTTSFLSPASGVPRRSLADYPSARRDDLRDDVLDCVARAESAGMETLVLDQTRPDTSLHVVKVIVPGLRHFWPRYGPGRLYDVPVKLGLFARPLAETELNLSPLEF